MPRKFRSILPTYLSLSFWRRPSQNGSLLRPRPLPLSLEQLEDRITPSATDITTLASFDGSNGVHPVGGLVMDGNGNLFGTSLGPLDTAQNYIFELAQGASTITKLAPISDNIGIPVGSLVMDGSGNLFGATEEFDGASGGTIFELVKGASTITPLATFNNTNGMNPNAGLVMDGGGNLYGTTNTTIFELAQGGGKITTLATFNAANGQESIGGLTLDGNGDLFGTTPIGGTSGDGTVFELVKGTGTITTLASFTGANGAGPQAGVVLDISGNLYGTTSRGGANNNGTIFEVAKNSGKITTLASFDGISGSFVASRLTLDDSGNLYGTTSGGGTSGDGTIFRLSQGSSTVITLASFDQTDGQNPDGYPVVDGSGYLFGTTSGGGVSGLGSVFKVQTTPPQPSQLVFMQQPGNTVAGATLSSVTVAIEDQFGNIETGDNSDTITLALGANPAGGTLSGTTTLTVHGGEATFNDLLIDRAGDGYMLTASTNISGIGPLASQAISITSGGSGGTGKGGSGGNGVGGGSSSAGGGGQQSGPPVVVQLGGFSLNLPAPGQSAGVLGMALEEFELVIDEYLAYVSLKMGQPTSQYNDAIVELSNAINSDPLPTPLSWYATMLGYNAALGVLA